MRPSNIFSKKSTMPRDWVATVMAIDIMSVGKAGQGPSSILGIWFPKSLRMASSCSAGTWRLPSASRYSTPSRLKMWPIIRTSSGTTSSMVIAERVIAASPMKEPISR